MSSLNDAQNAAVNNTQGPLLVLAGAGTGKTRVLTSRIIHIVNSYLASPMQILAVTFTNKAAAEMKHRIGATIGDSVNNLWIGTFHAIAVKILRRHPELVGLAPDFTIIDADDQLRLCKQILADMNIDPKQFPAKNYLGKISRYKDQMVEPHLLSAKDLATSLPQLKQVYEAYQSRLKSMNVADFGDLLLHNLKIFASAPEILAYYQDKFRYILVDEYQDTNKAQYQWLLRLATVHQNICCVGDDDQSIYSWRGADISNILQFEKDFADAKVIRLEQNYRSTSNILNAANTVISNNKSRHGKTLSAVFGSGEKVKLLSFFSDRSEALAISTIIKSYQGSKKFSLAQIAILVRAGYQTRSFEESFIQNSIPYKVIGGMKFYERLEIKDAICYLRLAANPNDDLALSRIINTPKRGIGDTSVADLMRTAKGNSTSLFSAIKAILSDDASKKIRAKEALRTLITSIEKWHESSNIIALQQLAKQILNDSGYINMWKAENSVEAKGRLENIDEFINSLADFSSMNEFLEYVSLVEAREDKNLVEAVSVMTVHGAKGLEFDAVFIPGLEDGVFPSGRAIDDKDSDRPSEVNPIEEERRLFYVAITRAKKELTISYSKSRYVYGDQQVQLPSRFLNELPKHEIEVRENYDSAFVDTKSSNTYGSASSYGNSYRNQSTFEQVNQGYGKQNYSSNFPAKSAVSSDKPLGDNLLYKRVFHQKFGYGKVIGIDGNKLEIVFEKTGTKTVVKDFVTMA